MALNSLDLSIVGPFIGSAWQRQLNTSEDPANGRWYFDGANHDGIGLYGGLSDAVPTGLVFNDNSMTYVPHQIMAASSIVDNRNGLVPQSTVQLSYSYTNSSTTSTTMTHSVKVGLGLDIKAKADFIIAGAEATVKMSVDYTFSYSSTTSETKSDTITVSQSVPVTVPTGKVYKAVLAATSQSLRVPYTATIVVTGKSETWFEDRINGHYNWMADAGTVWGWINQYRTAGDDSALYHNLGGGQGGVSVSGVLDASQVANFQVQVYDITGGSEQDVKRAMDSGIAAAGVGESLVPEGTLVKTIDI
jgi:Clostridium epsilon toxin ETX/Bacillus mosquitocidal toxin MTX2